MRSVHVTYEELAAESTPAADERIAYGNESSQFGELRLPQTKAPVPTIVLYHGGCWHSAFELSYLRPLAEALRQSGYATWNLEYRRLGESGGGWPGTFEDAAAGLAFIDTVAARYPQIDRTRIVLVGHSAGSQLALWAAREDWPRVRPIGLLSLAGIADLTLAGGACDAEVPRVMGGSPADAAARYRIANPLTAPALPIPVQLLHGAADTAVPVVHSQRLRQKLTAAGISTDLRIARGAGHFDGLAPHTRLWADVLDSIEKLLAEGAARFARQ